MREWAQSNGYNVSSHGRIQRHHPPDDRGRPATRIQISRSGPHHSGRHRQSHAPHQVRVERRPSLLHASCTNRHQIAENHADCTNKVVPAGFEPATSRARKP
ncbi:Lsr2 family DNA-binding protein [Nocardia nova]|uniref:Lsr2 family DNA-binding protein n=1 Tax=Nocardia nova TaxID=37330 RepID=UPI003F6C670A